MNSRNESVICQSPSDQLSMRHPRPPWRHHRHGNHSPSTPGELKCASPSSPRNSSSWNHGWIPKWLIHFTRHIMTHTFVKYTASDFYVKQSCDVVVIQWIMQDTRLYRWCEWVIRFVNIILSHRCFVIEDVKPSSFQHLGLGSGTTVYAVRFDLVLELALLEKRCYILSEVY